MSKDSNLVVEFRKIPSLKFLYEVSEDGRIVRNVKSKHQLKQHKDQNGYYVVVNKSVVCYICDLVQECYGLNKRQFISIIKDGETITFDSKAKCCRYISNRVGCSFYTIKQYLKQRRKRIHGYLVIYN